MLDGPYIHDSRIIEIRRINAELTANVKARDETIRVCDETILQLKSQISGLVGPWDGTTSPKKPLTEPQLRLLLNLSRVQWWVKSMAHEVLAWREDMEILRRFKIL